jgi:hypothetical protein
MSDLDFFAQLDAGLAKLTQKAGLEARKKSAIARAANFRNSPEVRQRAKDEVAGIKEELEIYRWQPVACVAFFAEQNCSYCGSRHRMFLQHMQKLQSIRTPASAIRWKRINRPDAYLPREVLIQKTITHMCVDCCADFNYSFAGGEVKFQDESVFNISASYHQEEVDDTSEIN